MTNDQSLPSQTLSLADLMSLSKDGLAEIEGFAAASTQIFNVSSLNNMKQHIQLDCIG